MREEAPREETTAMNPKSHSENRVSDSTIGEARPILSWNHPELSGRGKVPLKLFVTSNQPPASVPRFRKDVGGRAAARLINE